ncbi:MAG: transglutaminase domain-containing protein, partial [Acidobacteria bacterium]|nr:transglutaminase domain-containing protein [Acidobacteriota bacterium]
MSVDDPTPSDRRRAIEVTVISAAALAATSTFSPLYSDRSVALWVLLTTVACLSVSLILEIRRQSLAVVILVQLLAGALVVSYISLGNTMPSGVPSQDTFKDLADYVTHGFGHTLDAILPVARQSPTTTMLLAALWVALAVSLWLSRYSRSAVTPLIPLIVLFVLAQPLIAPTGATGVAEAVVFALLALILLIIRATPTSTSSGAGSANLPVLRSRLRVGLPLAIVATMLGCLAGAAIAIPMKEEPFDPRIHRDNIAVSTEAAHPLDQLKPNLNDPAEPHLNVAYENPEDALELKRLALAELDTYDGATWQSSNEYHASDGALTDGYPSTLPTERITYTIRLNRAVEPWVPVAALPVEISTDEVLIDDSSGTLIRSPAGRFTEYEATSEVLQAGSESLVDAQPDTTSAESVRYTELPPEVPDSLVNLGADLMGEGTTFEQLQNLERAIASIPYDDDATAGSSLARIDAFLFEEMRGYAEQHATSFALLARTQGIPTRLMVGYRLVKTEDGVGTPLERVTNNDYHVWPEVKFDEIGWVAFEPTPDPSLDIDELPTAGAEQPTRGNVVDQPTAEAPDSVDLEDTIDDPTRSRNRLVVASALAAVAVGFMLLALLFVVAIKTLRRRRRSALADPNQRVLGAWTEVTDRLRASGMALTSDLTVKEIVARSGSLSSGVNEALIPIIEPVQRSLFSNSPVDENTADL